ncbi:TlpA family protein disulfide reductase [Pseudobythopirellula maris]|nr:TlpA disulfide reductase family protein [Pseudobythopirellula maris]
MATVLTPLDPAIGQEPQTRLFDPAAAAIAPPPDTPLPRYRFEVGDELVYVKSPIISLLEGVEPSLNTSENRVYVASQNADGSSRLLIRQIIRFRSPADEEGEPPRVRFENDFLGYCDMRSDGSFALNHTLGGNTAYRTRPDVIFPPLPKTRERFANGWAVELAIEGHRYSGRVTGIDGDRVAMTGPVEYPLDANYETERTHQVVFDAERGLAVEIASDAVGRQNRYASHTQWRYELVCVERRSPEWLKEFSQEADRYFEADRLFWDAITQVNRIDSREEFEGLSRSVTEPLEALLRDADTPEMRELTTARLALWKREKEFLIDDVEERQAILALPPANWETTDFQGAAHSRSDYAGRVVLLDFWNRGCSHCILAMPKIEELHRRYADRGVVVLGVNQDVHDEDARFVIDSQKIPYPTLRNNRTDGEGQTISAEFKIHSFPMFLLLDQSGRVAALVSGNHDNLVEVLAEKIERLLENPPSE